MSPAPPRGRRGRAATDDTPAWQGAYVPYDLVKEFVIALGVVALLAVVLTVLFSSPDDRPEHDRPVGEGQPV